MIKDSKSITNVDVTKTGCRSKLQFHNCAADRMVPPGTDTKSLDMWRNCVAIALQLHSEWPVFFSVTKFFRLIGCLAFTVLDCIEHSLQSHMRLFLSHPWSTRIHSSYSLWMTMRHAITLILYMFSPVFSKPCYFACDFPAIHFQTNSVICSRKLLKTSLLTVMNLWNYFDASSWSCSSITPPLFHYRSKTDLFHKSPPTVSLLFRIFWAAWFKLRLFPLPWLLHFTTTCRGQLSYKLWLQKKSYTNYTFSVK